MRFSAQCKIVPSVGRVWTAAMLGLHVCLFLLLSSLAGGCRKAMEFQLVDELKPVTERDLIEMPEGDLERVDIARMNIICARAAFQGKARI